MTNFIKKIARWYFSKSAMPYWMVLFFDCSVVLVSNLIIYVLDMGATYTALHFWPFGLSNTIPRWIPPHAYVFERDALFIVC